jgi:pimeloyl-ACP methyl ester carboxylesterase
MQAICDFLTIRDLPTTSDLIFVLAGRPERKCYGLRLFQEGFAKRLILSVGRFEVRQAATLALNETLDLRELASRTPPEQRHFFADLAANSRRISVVGHAMGTHWELNALAAYLRPHSVSSILIVSTSVHLRRVRWCCERIDDFQNMGIRYLPVPEESSSFRRSDWWKRLDHWSYLTAEYIKLASYEVRFRRWHRRTSL